MAETFLSPLIEKLVGLLAEEIYLLRGVRKEVKTLKDELEIIQPFLRDAEAKSEKGEVNNAAKVWLKQIRKQAYRIKDVVDEYLYHVEQHRHDGGFIGSLRKGGHYIKTLKLRYDIASEIKEIKESLREIKDRGVGYGLRPLEQGSSSSTTNNEARDPRLGSLFLEEDEIVGINGATEELIGRLTGGLSMRSVTSLVGQGGIGKTTLARKVYNDEVVKAHFDCRAWITVSQSYDMQKLLRILARQICTAGERIEEDCSEEELIGLLRQHLQTKRYMIVFDDVWQKEFWKDIKHALPNKDKGSRIIITTRNFTVASFCRENPCDLVHEVQTWSSEMAWQLFCKKAFRSDEFAGRCPQELEQLSREIVSKCLGLPLVISTIAGLLSTKERVDSEWRKVLNNISSEYQRTDITKILSLSYLDLPYHLKTCFLYFSIFGEDHKISESTLYKLWSAEGFVKARSNKTLEDVAEEYLNELIQRNLVLFEIEFGVERVCKVHDLMHDIILTRAGELCFSQTIKKSNLNLVENSYRLSIHDTTENVLERVMDSSIRSVFLFDVKECTRSFMINLVENFKLLEVLDFAEVPLDDLPKEVGKLFHLKYLCLSGTRVKVLPKSIGKLHNLQTLDARNTLVTALPIEITKLRNLRHLRIYSIAKNSHSGFTYCGVRIRGGIGMLEELQTLEKVEAYPDGVGFVKELQKLRKLKRLDIYKVTAEMGEPLGVVLEKMNHLERLILTSINKDEVINLKCISSPPPFLRYLQLNCRLEQLPNWVSELHNLQGLSLSYSRFIDDPMKCLHALPNLSYLRMAYDGGEMHFQKGGFPKLKQLKFDDLKGLKVVRIDVGALPLLEEFHFGRCALMKEMPSDIQHLSNLKSFSIHDMPREFVVRLQPDGGIDYWKIQHVPSVTFHYYNRGYYKLGSSDLIQHLQRQAS
ncbi:disease resistance protein RPM1 [Morus notabilis]|uniref:disease resistance protein RPM1 n=1 Tax=Morus notabilis TaxID=981085 RepID=UPI000CED0587|nr:disease resistance protein RPM1 [Morus notabilis]